MKTQTKPISRGIAIHRSIVPTPNTRTIQSRIASRPTPSQRTSVSGISNTRAPQAAAGLANRNASQPDANQRRGVTQRVAANALNQRGPIHPASPFASKTPRYNVQAPMPLGGGNQRIRATIQGTPQIAGSVEIRAAGPGRVYISNLSVDQQHRRRGVAAKLIDAAVSAARRQGFRAVSLEARPSDNGISPQALVAMYRRQGFKSVGKSGRGSPLMERKL